MCNRDDELAGTRSYYPGISPKQEAANREECNAVTEEYFYVEAKCDYSCARSLGHEGPHFFPAQHIPVPLKTEIDGLTVSIRTLEQRLKELQQVLREEHARRIGKACCCTYCESPPDSHGP